MRVVRDGDALRCRQEGCGRAVFAGRQAVALVAGARRRRGALVGFMIRGGRIRAGLRILERRVASIGSDTDDIFGPGLGPKCAR